MNGINQAIILAAGKGERLYPLTSTRPKVMLSVANKPILQYVIEALVGNKIKEIIIVAGYYREQIQNYFASGSKFGVNIKYAIQEHQLGTGHALMAARHLAEDRFLVLPGDNIVNANTIFPLSKMFGDTILAKHGVNQGQHGMVIMENKTAKEIVENPMLGVSPWINTGTYLFQKHIFAYLEEELHLPDAVNNMILDGRNVSIESTDGIWMDAVYPWDLLEINGSTLGEISSKLISPKSYRTTIKGPVELGSGSIIGPNSYVLGPVVIGDGCEIGPNVCIFPYTSIGDNVVVESFTQIRNSIIGKTVQIGSHSILNDSIVGDNCTIGARFTVDSYKKIVSSARNNREFPVGAIIGDFVDIGSSVTLTDGISVGKGSKIRDGNLVRENVSEETLVI